MDEPQPTAADDHAPEPGDDAAPAGAGGAADAAAEVASEPTPTPSEPTASPSEPAPTTGGDATGAGAASAGGTGSDRSPDAPRTAAAAELFAQPRSTDDTWEEEESLLSWQLFAVVFVVLLVVGVAAVKIFGGKPVSSTDSATSGAASGANAGADIRDDFSGTSNAGLGTTSTGQKWEETGTWGKKDGHAYLVAPNKEGGRSLALVDLGAGNGSVSADAVTIANGWGLVFRYKGPFNYWMVTASPKFGTYNIQKVVDGKIVPADKVLAKVQSGTVVTVEYRGNSINLKLNDEVVKTVEDCFSGGGTKVGLVAADAAGGQEAQWGDFAASKIDAPAAAPKAGDDCSGKGGGAAPKAGNSTTTAPAESTTPTTGAQKSAK